MSPFVVVLTAEAHDALLRLTAELGLEPDVCVERCLLFVERLRGLTQGFSGFRGDPR